jgi:hypothetical protein
VQQRRHVKEVQTIDSKQGNRVEEIASSVFQELNAVHATEHAAAEERDHEPVQEKWGRQ